MVFKSLMSIVACAVLFSSTAEAQQFVIFDETWTHGPNTPDSHLNIDARPEAPNDFTSPVNYAAGKVHMWLDVKTKPTDERTRFQVCFGSKPQYSCTNQSQNYTQTGLVEWETSFDQFWSPGSPDWRQGVPGKVSAILKDTENGKPTADNVGDQRAARFVPTDLRLVVTVVAPGTTYEPPNLSAMMDAGVADASVEDASPDADSMDAAVGDADSPDASIDATPDALAPDTSNESRDGGVESDADDGSALSGTCQIGTAHNSTTWWLALPLLALFRNARSRRHDEPRSL